MTVLQRKRVESFKRRVSVKGAVVDDDGTVLIGWERSRDGRDMTTRIGTDGRTISTKPTYRYP